MNLAGWEAVILLAVGLILLGVEGFVLPGFGVAGVLGLLAIVASLLYSVFVTLPTGGDLLLAVNVIIAATVVLGVVGWQVFRSLPRGRDEGRGLLRTRADRDAGYISAPPRAELVGREGIAATDLRPAGTGVFGDDRLDVVSDGPFVAAGTPIRIVRSEGYRHVVHPEPPPA